MSEIKQVFEVAGRTFETRAEANNFIRRPKIKTALVAVTGGKQDVAEWLLDNQEAVEMAFETGTIRRVSKSERRKLEKAVEHLKTLTGDSKLSFLVEHADVIQQVFRWPTVTRLNEEQKVAAIRKALVDAAEGREDLADWIVANKDAVLAAYEAGVEKRPVSNKATEALAAYRAKKDAEKKAKAESEAKA